MLTVIRIPRKFIGYFILLALLNWLVLPLAVNEKRVFAGENKPSTESEIKNVRNKVPLFFEANQGQYDKRVKFSADGSGYKLFLTMTEAVYVIPERVEKAAQNSRPGSELPAIQDAKPSRAVSVWMKLSGANQDPEAIGVDEVAGKHNYFKGSDQSKWQSNVPLYQKARFGNVYEGVDVEWRSSETGSIEHDFKVSPFASARQIEWQIEGADSIKVEADGSLVISTPFGDLKQNAPVTYQEIDGVQSVVESRFEMRGKTSVGFAVDDYDDSKPLTIDPVTDLEFSTFLGGGADETGNAIKVGGDGTIYVTGNTFSTSFPTTAGTFDGTYNDNGDVFVTRLDRRGETLIYSTYIGGGGSDSAYGIAVDQSDNAYITGFTSASETPYPTTPGALSPNHNGDWDAFVTKLNFDGTALEYSTFIGGSGRDQGNAIGLKSGNAYITGFTTSGNFPTTSGVFDTDLNSGRDAFVAKLNLQGSELDYSTYLGGAVEDAGRGIGVDAAGNAIICGDTFSFNAGVPSDYPTTPGAFDPTYNGAGDAFVTKVNAIGSDLIYSTFIGGGSSDAANALALDAFGNAYVTGHTYYATPEFPTTPGAFDTTYNGANATVFVAKFNAEGSGLEYSTLIGTDEDSVGYAIAVNNAGNAFITGKAELSSIPFPTTPGAFDTTPNTSFGDDVFFTKLTASGAALVYSTFIGGSGTNDGYGIALNSSGAAFMTGNTTNNTTDFPTTAGVFQPNINGASDAFVCKFRAMSNFPPTVSVVTNTNDGGAGSLRQAIQNANDSVGIDDIIQFSSLFNTPQTISISDHLQIASNITIQGPGANLLTVRNTSPATFVSRVFNMISGTINVSGITMSGGKGNLSGGGIYNTANLTVNNCAISDNHPTGTGGAIYNLATLNVLNSTLSGNSAQNNNSNGAIYNEGTLNVTNSTISGNTSRGIVSSGDGSLITITNSTIVNNVISSNATGIYLFRGNVTIRNSIIAGNFPGNGPDVQVAVGTLVSGGYNLIGNASAVTAFNQIGDQTGSDTQILDPRLFPLAFNGGTTQTHALLPNSTAIDTGNSFGLTTDQRGFTRPFDIPGIFNLADGSDVGAFESRGNKSTFDFDGDGKTDISIFRPSVGEWWYLKSSNGGNAALQFGVSTDKLTPADFTGDGKTDIAFWRPSTGFWYILRSEDFSFLSFPFGANGDVPLVGDFDADGKADPTIYRPATREWFILKSTGGTTITTFGAAGDKPVVADYDGDGKTDIAIYRPSTGEWWIQRSSNASVYAFQFGMSSDKPVQGDYTGDGKADSAFFRPLTGEWFILRSENSSFYSVPFGTNGDAPSPGDYDGDGRFDTAVFRPSNSTWYINRTMAGIAIVGFGAPGDRSVPNAFVP